MFFRLESCNASKTPLSVLHQLCLKKGYIPQYNLLGQEGRTHEQLFFFNCHIADLTTNGQGSSKKKARHHAAQNMILLISKLNKTEHPLYELQDIILKMIEEDKGLLLQDEENDKEVLNNSESDTNTKNDNPVGELLDFCIDRRIPPPEYKLVDAHGMAHERMFIMEVKLENYSAQAEGKSKKFAKRLAAQKLLESVKEKYLKQAKEDGTNPNQEKGVKTFDDLIKCNVYPIKELILDNAKSPGDGISPKKLHICGHDTMYLEFNEPKESLKLLLTMRLPKTEGEFEELIELIPDKKEDDIAPLSSPEKTLPADLQTNGVVDDLPKHPTSRFTIDHYNKLLKKIAIEQDFSLNYTHHFNPHNTKYPYIVYLELGTTPMLTNAAIGKSKKEAFDRCLLDTLKLIVDTVNSHDTWKSSYDKVLAISNKINALNNNISNQSLTQLSPQNTTAKLDDKCEEDNLLSHPDIFEIPIENIINQKELESNLQTDKSEMLKRKNTRSNTDWFFGNDDFPDLNNTLPPTKMPKNGDETCKLGSQNNQKDQDGDSLEDEEVDNLFADFNTSGMDSQLTKMLGQMSQPTE